MSRERARGAKERKERKGKEGKGRREKGEREDMSEGKDWERMLGRTHTAGLGMPAGRREKE